MLFYTRVYSFGIDGAMRQQYLTFTTDEATYIRTKNINKIIEAGNLVPSLNRSLQNTITENAAVTFRTCIQEVCGSNLDPDAGYPD
jgi:hypothetical protein